MTLADVRYVARLRQVGIVVCVEAVNGDHLEIIDEHVGTASSIITVSNGIDMLGEYIPRSHIHCYMPIDIDWEIHGFKAAQGNKNETQPARSTADDLVNTDQSSRASSSHKIT